MQNRLNCGLHQNIPLKCNGIYKITSNISTSDGLVNGAAGRLEYISYAIHPKSSARIPAILFMSFGDSTIGKGARMEFFNTYKQREVITTNVSSDWVPITFKKLSIVRTNFIVDRIQFPITPARVRHGNKQYAI